MNNYEYIIAGLPVLQPDYRGKLDTDAILEEIRSQLSEKDSATLDYLLSGWGEELDEAFYRRASAHSNAFIRDYFAYDLQLRNAKVAFLNKELGRPAGQDAVAFGPEDFDDRPKVDEVLAMKDILGRERGLDELLWARIDELTVMHVFDMDTILGFTAKLKIVDRWTRLDPETGREMFRRLVSDLKDNYTLEIK